jgi:hypothetical protein
MSSAHFIIYSRSYCHLCEEMLQALQKLRPAYDFSVEMQDVDANAALLERYDELVPVLLGWHGEASPRQLCHYFLNEEVVVQFLQEAH